ncbi:helix-turn-helix domain-containing protein [Loigolactobacillus binensis]|uniref:HTH marR-type domain-containing protein n=1 Tax=Loigolactobacillus binensis TaxID=2559922 RepID=A0ABW3EE00_9LACO|nr:hypothetical protein [Loigolactobacillus binensis]
MTDEITDLLAAIRDAQQQHEVFKADFWQFAVDHLADDIPASSVAKFKALKMTHSEMQILSQLAAADADWVPYKVLQAQVPFSQGMFSRYIKRLTKAALITKTKRPENKKEVLLAITTVGTQVAVIHSKMHTLEHEHLAKRLQQFDAAQLQTAIRVLNSIASEQP